MSASTAQRHGSAKKINPMLRAAAEYYGCMIGTRSRRLLSPDLQCLTAWRTLIPAGRVLLDQGSPAVPTSIWMLSVSSRCNETVLPHIEELMYALAEPQSSWPAMAATTNHAVYANAGTSRYFKFCAIYASVGGTFFGWVAISLPVLSSSTTLLNAILQFRPVSRLQRIWSSSIHELFCEQSKTGVAIPAMTHDSTTPPLLNKAISWFFLSSGELLEPFLAGRFSDHFGRLFIIGIGVVVFTTGATILTAAVNVSML
jgi:hypothetical protein